MNDECGNISGLGLKKKHTHPIVEFKDKVGVLKMQKAGWITTSWCDFTVKLTKNKFYF